jgi:hypothetical protein
MDWPQYQPGPLVAVQRFLRENNSLIRDDCEKFILTYAPGGRKPEPPGRALSGVEDEKLLRCR